MRIAVLERAGASGHYVLEGDRARKILGDAFSALPGGLPLDPRAEAFTMDELRAPVAPSKIVCVARNYAEHAKELGNAVPEAPRFFLKPPSSVIGPGQVVVLPPESARVDHEAELALVIGRRCRRASRDAASRAIFGYTCACDVTARDLQSVDGQWWRAKGFDTFCPLGPWIETELDATDVRIRCLVDGAVRQDGRTSQMVFDVPSLVSAVSQAMTLEVGDVILTGTPAGVGPLAGGNRLVVAIDGIGELSVTVTREPSSSPLSASEEPATVR